MDDYLLEINEGKNDILTVSELNLAVKALIENTIGSIKVSGEISNLSRPSSGHMYWTLKDERAQIRCAMFRAQASKLNFDLDNGDEIVITGKVTLYPEQGSYQIICNNVSEVGEGKLRKKYDFLKKKLEKEGLFKAEHKKIIPSYPRTIGVITSSTGAALRDILATTKRRFPAIPIIIYPTLVQGSEAPERIIKMIRKMDEQKLCDVVILARGGGSLEDLWAFNDEGLARVLFECRTPIVSGVGHENDFTITDYVADLRAATPTAAAEHVTPHQSEISNKVLAQKRQLVSFIFQKIQQAKHDLLIKRNTLEKLHPIKKLQSFSQTIDLLNQRLSDLTYKKLNHISVRLEYLSKIMSLSKIRLIMNTSEKELSFLSSKLHSLMIHIANRYQEQLRSLSRQLDLQSPLKVIERGYSITKVQGKGTSLRQVFNVAKGDIITTQLTDGEILSKVLDIKKLS
jgi:exodeoxyribonuclease VII large subunit